MRTGEEGVKKSQNFADVIYGWPLSGEPCSNINSNKLEYKIIVAKTNHQIPLTLSSFLSLLSSLSLLV